MIRRLPYVLPTLLLLAMMLFFGCRGTNYVQRGDDYCLVFYPLSRKLSIGETQIGLRIQSRDYKILEVPFVRLRVIDSCGAREQQVTLQAGPGKDLRGWVQLDRAGKYELVFEFVAEPGPAATVCFLIKVPES
ncbi:hypothetical protein KAR10_04405 [bacterium]|nr:hypothetical protein [bacterium]